MTAVLDSTYRVSRHEYEEWPGTTHLEVSRRDGEPITDWTDLQQLAAERAPGARLQFVHLWLLGQGAAPVATVPDGNGSSPPAVPAAVTAATAAPSPAASVPVRRARPVRRGATLNLSARELISLRRHLDAYLISEEADVDDELAVLEAIRAKLARLAPPQHREAVTA